MQALEFFHQREQLGEETKIKNVAHVLVSERLVGPSDQAEWPEEYQVLKQTITLNRVGIKAAIKGGQVVDGFEVMKSKTVVFK